MPVSPPLDSRGEDEGGKLSNRKDKLVRSLAGFFAPLFIPCVFWCRFPHAQSLSLSLCPCAATVFGGTLKTYLAGRTSPNGRRPQCKLKRHMGREGMVQDGLRAKPTRTIFARASRAGNGERAPATRFELVRLGKKSLKYDFEEI